jgi:UDP-2,3-diacylglucosamine pyrophosphatase LpxH
MLVIISDLHLTDGSSGETVHQGTLRVFRERLRNLAYAASWRADGKYRPIEEMNIVLLGDILDALRSSKWLEEGTGNPSSVRPWDDPRSEAFVQKVDAITKAILARNAIFFTMLRELQRTSLISIPLATENGRPTRVAQGAGSLPKSPVRVRIHYMVGNHDWFYHHPHPAYQGIREKIVEALGLENDPRQPFPHDPMEPFAAAIQQVFDEHRVFARHGDIYDPFNFEEHRDQASLGDAIVIDLLSNFAAEVKSKLGDSLPLECLAGFQELDNVRPLLMAPVWLGGLLRRTCPDRRVHRQVQEVWNDLAGRFLKIPFVRQHLTARRSWMHAQKLQWALRLSRGLLSPESGRIICWAGERVGSRKCSYYPYALREQAFRSRKARFIIYGHTHRHEMIPLDSSYLFSQLYLNSGTWRPVHELTRFQPNREAFIGYHTMTYLAFFKDDERNGRAFESWSGGLAKSVQRFQADAEPENNSRNEGL